MNAEHIKTLNRLFEDGYLIMLQYRGYELDEQVTMIENLSDNDEEPDWQIETETRQLSMEDITGLFLNEVRVFARVDWMGFIPKEDQAIHNHIFGTDTPVSLQDWNDNLDNAYDEAGD